MQPFAGLHNLSDIVPLLQASISPVTVISGVGLLVLSMTNRYGRVIDRVRSLIKEEKAALRDIHQSHKLDPSLSDEILETGHELKYLFDELKILYTRARVLRWCIFFSLLCLFLIAVTISLLFSGLVLGLDLKEFTSEAFLMALAMLLTSLGFFLRDIALSLKALKIEIGHHVPWKLIGR
jgi:hypothetical protein